MPAQSSAMILPPAPRPAARWKARCAAFLCLAASAVAAPHVRAQATGTLTTIGYLNGATGSGPNKALTLAPDGNFYGIAPSGGPNNLGTFFRVTPGGTVTLLYSFGDDGSGAVSPTSRAELASDGSFYGIATPSQNGTQIPAIAYRVTTAGVFGVVHRFQPNTSFPNDTVSGATLVPRLTLGNDGNFYGVTENGGNKSAANPTGDGTIFRLNPNGNFTTLYSFNFNQTGVGGSDPDIPLVLGRDGNFYGVTLYGGDFGVGSVYKLTPDGTVTTIHSFSGQEGTAPVGALVEGDTGIFYGINTAGGTASHGTFFSVTINGVVNILHSFTASELSIAPQSGLTRGTDGNFYLSARANGTVKDHVLQLSPTGVAITAFQFTSTAQGSNVLAALTQAADGSFYGVTAAGGPSADGTVFRLTFKPHPPFYDGEVDLNNGIEYLQFPNGNIFGYYGFLSDPRYIYHLDLGYEYVIDAADSSAGVYLYDFKSGHFFYTSPLFPFPYLYDFSLAAILYYYPNPNNPQRYNINGLRYFYNFSTKRVFTQ